MKKNNSPAKSTTAKIPDSLITLFTTQYQTECTLIENDTDLSTQDKIVMQREALALYICLGFGALALYRMMSHQ